MHNSAAGLLQDQSNGFCAEVEQSKCADTSLLSHDMHASDRPQAPVGPSSPQSSGVAWKRWAVTSICLVAALAVSVVATVGLRPGSNTQERSSALNFLAKAESLSSSTRAWDLLRSPAFHAVATDNLMDVSQDFLGPADRELVHAIVAEAFANLTRGIDKHAPAAAKALRNIQLVDALQAALLDSARLLSNAEVLRIGLRVAEAIRDSRSQDSKDVLSHINDSLSSQQEEIRLLRQKLLPDILRDIPPASGLTELALGVDNLRIMTSVDSSWVIEDVESSEEPSVPEWYADLPKLPAEDYRRRLDWDHYGSSRNPFWRAESFQMRHSDQTKGIQEGVVEQSRVLLAILRYLPTGRGLHDSGSASRFNIKPEEARVLEDVSLERLLLETSEPVSCGAGTSHGMACLLKFGTQGLAALYRSEQQDDH